MSLIKPKAKTCKICGSSFKTKSPYVLICSDKCRNKKKAARAKKRREELKKNPEEYSKYLEYHRSRYQKKHEVGDKKVCKNCHKDFLLDEMNIRNLYCSKKCQKESQLVKRKKDYEVLKNDNEKYKEVLEKNRSSLKKRYLSDENYRENQKSKTQKRRKENPDKEKNIRRSYYLRIEKKKNSTKENREKRQEKWKVRYYTDPVFRAKEMIKSRLRRSLKLNYKDKPGSFNDAFGCDLNTFRVFIEGKFTEGMTWENHGEWHLDHIIPLSSFDLSDIDEFQKANHYLNFQPLWAKDNLEKSNKLNWRKK